MSDYEQAVLISYAWNGESEEMVNQIERSLQERGIHIIHDQRDLDYKGLIGKFMEQMGRGTCVIVVISDAYLRSPNCMFELVEIADGRLFHDRIFPLVLKDADIYDPIKRIEYVRYWEVKRNELAEAMRTLDPANLQGIRDDMDLYDHIQDRISGLASTLKDMNALTPEVHRTSDFSELYTAIEKRLKENEGPTGQYFEPQTVLIREDPFLMGSPQGSGAPANESPQHTLKLPAYRIGIYPVTNSQYEEFVREKHTLVAPVTRWDGQRVPPRLENYPVMGVTWYQALAYCEWLSEKTGHTYSLPNEAQWEKACRGVNGFLYPWGNEVEKGRSNHGCESVSAVDAYPAQTESGCFDMVGNVRQWTCSLWGGKRSQPDALYCYPWKNDQRNSLSANRQVRRVVRGNSMRDAVTALSFSSRSGQLPKDTGLPHGFRVVIDLEEH